MKLHILPLLVISILLSACGNQSGNTSGIDYQVGQYLKLIEARRSPQLDLDKIKSLYESVSDILTEAGLKAQADDYLKQTDGAEHPSPYLQGVEKTFQQAVVRLIHKELYKTELDDSAVDKVAAYFTGLRSTAERRGKYFGSDVFFVDAVDSAVEGLKGGENESANSEKIKTAIDDVYFLSVLYELEGIAKNRGKNDIIVHEKQIEGVIFYDIISASAKNKIASGRIEKELAKDGNEMDLDLVKEQLRIAFPQKSLQYAKKF